MFTGIVSDLGKVARIDRTAGGMRATIESSYAADKLEIGCSIAHAGCCLTIIDFGPTDAGCWFTVEISNESLDFTNLGEWQLGARINLERALAMGEELGGHLVTGHVDGVAEIISRQPDGDSERFVFRVPEDLAPYIASKGSVTLDGTSLTVNEVEGREFGVNLIPHTLKVTTWGDRAIGDRINLEIDIIARYVARLLEYRV
ncbi:MAG: riboflavin synthase [Fimbriimonadaceae bacterium]|nr:riboflavin synthase [Alphaproteobacteria bacterium]